MAKQVMMKGNEAIAEAAIRAGCLLFFGYPITPQNEIPEYMSAVLPKRGGTFVQSESELASISMVYGAGGTGTRVMTSSSSVGISLMQEGISYMAAAEIPGVIVNMMRGGPGLGGILAAQGDYFQATRGGGNGDYFTLTLAPASVQEACDLVQLAFDLADQYRTPVVLLGDGMIGQMMEPVVIKTPERKTFDKSWATTGWDGHSRPRAILNSLYTDCDELEAKNALLQSRYKQMEEEEVRWEEYNLADAEYIFVAYGTVARISKSAVGSLRARGIKAGLFRPITLFPFPYKQLRALAAEDRVKHFITTEMCAGQMVQDVELAVRGQKPIGQCNKMGSKVPTARDLAQFAEQIVKGD